MMIVFRKKTLFFLAYIALAVLALTGCHNQKTMNELEAISQIADEHPDSALTMLKVYEDKVDRWSKVDRMHYELVKMKAQNKANVLFSSDSIAKEVADYYNHHGTDNERLLANYLLGRVYSDMGEAPQALQAFYDAIECADTLSDDCDYDVLIPVYGQMSQIFYMQNLPHDEIWALRHYIDYIHKTDSEKEYIIAKEQLINPYYQLGEKDSVLAIINDTYTSLKRIGEDREAADALVASVYIYIERGQLDEARRVMDIFEHESGLFDAQGNIEKGRENYYYIRGTYELEVNKVDAAEKDFRRAINSCFTVDAYRGLVSLYHKKRNIDSVMHFTLLHEQALDSVHNQMQIDAIHQMSSMYNYSRSQKLAEQEAHNARIARIWTIGILFTVLLGVSLTYKLYLSYKRKKQEEIDLLSKSLSDAKKEYQVVQSELLTLNNRDIKKLIADKEKKEKELRQTIERLEASSGLPTDKDSLEKFDESVIAKVFRRKQDNKLEKPSPRQAEWRALVLQFSKEMPAMHHMLVEEKKLSPLELNVCILILLGFDDASIGSLTGSIPQTITKAKARANMKLFGVKGAHGLKRGLFLASKDL
ncbi:MAG: hypothetical protein K6D91_02530 [Prevotella sp.]|nr:hypothetical protein [Prevotella sp.]